MEVKVVRRGFDKDDTRWFSKENMKKLKTAQEELVWLLDRGYKIERILDLVGDKNQFSKRQRMALMRSTASSKECQEREKKCLDLKEGENGTIYIDGFNLIITLEVALSKSKVLLGNDGVIRDLAGLRGTYKIIDKTYTALELIGKTLDELLVPGVIFYLDQPVSNSGMLKQLTLAISKDWNSHVDVEIVRNPDVLLMKMGRVVSGDKVILNHCESWFNLANYIIKEYLEDADIVDLY
ncbi:DUF434 domain-containing protein [Vallitalea okinawensis]|uniref:DUF434 domain-containing protein n=1 Tax=Vallitalea okinawensis TaxID=2078660 RepID=UPI000CFC5D6A|nr:DUF434 domain-containing protein [Vallitalea okinawensis]